MLDTRNVPAKIRLPAAALLLLALSASAVAPARAAWEFDVRFKPAAHKEPFTGRVYLLFSKTRPEPRRQWWFFNIRQEPCASIDAEGWKPGESLKISSGGAGVLTFPRDLAEKNLDGYRVQAVARFNPRSRTIGTGEGNGFSRAVTIRRDKPAPTLVIDRVIEPRKFRETRWVKELKVRSKLLSDFHGRDVFLHAAVLLPASYYDSDRSGNESVPDAESNRDAETGYPTIYEIPGFGGTHHARSGRDRPVAEKNEHGVEFLRVLLDPSCPLGHHVFADSASNGPVGRALTTELIPAFEKRFPAIAEPAARLLTGHSSGGWSSLWLQVAYPDYFGGVWSTAPDPVDFRDFQRINLYRPGENMYFDEQGRRRPIARAGGRVLMTYQDFAWNEWVLGPGGQLHSFEAVFSPRGKDGRPRRLWDRRTGEINTAVAKTWEKYDIRLVLERNWKTLGEKLAGKLHVHMGDRDTFYLEGATILLKTSLERLGSDAVVVIHKGKDHGSVMTRELRDRIRREMVRAFLKGQADGAP